MSARAAEAPQPGLRERKKAKLRARIAETTLSLIRERGYEATTVEEIVRRVEISQPTFYNYYPSKEAILAEHATRGWGALLAEAARRPGSVAERLADCLHAIAGDVTRDAELWRAVALSNAYNPVRDPQLLTDPQAGTRVMEALLEDGQRRGELTREVSPQLMASVLEGIMLRAVIEWGAGFPDDTPLDRRMQAMLAFFLRGATRQPDEPAPDGDEC